MGCEAMDSDPAARATHRSRGALEYLGACPVCGSRVRTLTPMNCSDQTADMASDCWCIHRCGACRSLYLDPRPDEASLASVYDQYFTHTAEREEIPERGLGRLLWAQIQGYLNANYGFSRRPAARLGRWLFKLLPPLRLKLDYYARHLSTRRYPIRGRLLDVGCGKGAFLARAKEMGWESTGLDPDPQAVIACHAQGLNALEGSLTALPVGIGSGYDVITMSHSIEHVHDIRAALKGAASILGPCGTLWIALPNPDSLGAMVFASAWRGLHPPYHLCIPPQKVLSRLLRECGYTDVKFIRRGSHARMMMRESAEKARVVGGVGMVARALMAPCLRLLSDVLATLSSRHGEETVVVAVRAER